MDVTVRYVRASSERTCDGLTLLGKVNKGEFQVLIQGVLGPASNALATEDYGESEGKSHTLDAGEIRNFTNRTWRHGPLQFMLDAMETL